VPPLPELRQPLFRPGVSARLRLIGRLPRKLRRGMGDPRAVLALRLRAAGGLRWRIADDTLTLIRPDMADLALPLAGVTVQDLADGLATVGSGIEVAYASEDPDIRHLSALALIPGEGDQDRSNGDHIHAFTRPDWAWLGAVGRWIERARADLPEALKQLVLPTSEEEWSDYWASYFGLVRRAGEQDAHLNMRTAYEWRRPRSNPHAIAQNIRVLHGVEVTVREPWREMMVLSGSEVSGDHHLPNASEFIYHWAQLRSPDFIDWAPIMAEAEQDRPAGTLLLPPVTAGRALLVEWDGGGGVDLGITTTIGDEIRDYDGHILDFTLSLSDTFAIPAPSLGIYDTQGYSAVNEQDPGPLDWFRTIAVGEITLSEAPPLGDLQAHLAGGRMLAEDGDPMALSGDDALSDYDYHLGWAPIDEWLEASLALSVVGPLDYPPQRDAGVIHVLGFEVDGQAERPTDASIETVIALDLPGIYDRGWRGKWDQRTWSQAGYAEPSVGVKMGTPELIGSMFAYGEVMPLVRAANLTTAVRLTGRGNTSAVADADLTVNIALSASAQSVARVVTAPTLSVASRFQAVSATEPDFSAELKTAIRFTGSGAASATATGILSTNLSLRGVIAAEASVPKANLVVPGRMEALAQASATVTRANLAVNKPLQATAQSLAAVKAASLDTSIRLTASRQSLASFLGARTLTTKVALKATVSAIATASAASMSSAAPPAQSGTTTVTYQEGVNGYASTLDCNIQQGNPTATGGGISPIFVNSGNWTAEIQSLLRFNSLIGTGAGQVPSGSSIASATLTLNTEGTSALRMAIRRMLMDWTESSTWTSTGTGVQGNDVEAQVASLAQFTPSTAGPITIDVTVAVQAWADGAANYGFLLCADETGSDNWTFTSSEGATVANRPKLTVTYGAQAWPSAGRSYLFDPDQNATLNGSSQVTSMTDAGGGTLTVNNQGVAGYSPATVTAFGRRMMDFNNRTGLKGLFASASGGSLQTLMADLDGPATYAMVWSPPAALGWAGDMPLFGNFNFDNDYPANRLVLDGADATYPQGSFYLARHNGSSNFDRRWSPPAGFAWDSSKAYVIVLRYNSGGTVDLFVDGTAWTSVNLGYAGTPTTGATMSGGQYAIGYQERSGATPGVDGTGIYESAEGRIGAFMRFNSALTQTAIDNLTEVKDSRYRASGVQSYPSASRSINLDFDSQYQTVVSGQVSEVTMADDGNAWVNQGTAAQRPASATMRGRGVATFDPVAPDSLWPWGSPDASWLSGQVGNHRTVRTMHFVWFAPATMPGTRQSLLAYRMSQGFDAYRQGYTINAAGRPEMYFADVSGNFTTFAPASGATIAGGSLNLVTFRVNSDATVDLFLNGTKYTKPGGTIPNASVDMGNGTYAFGRIPYGTPIEPLSGSMATFLNYAVAQTDAEVAAVWAAVQSRYPA
jgi:hypothetical protein